MAARKIILTLSPYRGQYKGKKRWKWRLTSELGKETNEVTFLKKGEAQKVLKEDIQTAHEAGFIVDATFTDQTGGGDRAVYALDGSMDSIDIEPKSGLLGPRCRELPRGYIKKANGTIVRGKAAAGGKSAKKRLRALTARNSWADLLTAIKNNRVGLKARNGALELTKIGVRVGKKYVATSKDFEVVAGLIVGNGRGAKRLGSFPPVYEKPKGVARKQRTEAQVLARVKKAAGKKAKKRKTKRQAKKSKAKKANKYTPFTKKGKEPGKKTALGKYLNAVIRGTAEAYVAKLSGARITALKRSAAARLKRTEHNKLKALFKKAEAAPEPPKKKRKTKKRKTKKRKTKTRKTKKHTPAVQAYLDATDGGKNETKAAAYLGSKSGRGRGALKRSMSKARLTSKVRGVFNRAMKAVEVAEEEPPPKPTRRKSKRKSTRRSRRPKSKRKSRKPKPPPAPAGAAQPAGGALSLADIASMITIE